MNSFPCCQCNANVGYIIVGLLATTELIGELNIVLALGLADVLIGHWLLETSSRPSDFIIPLMIYAWDT